MAILIVRGPTYYAQGDEDAFFTWLQSIPCVANVGGEGLDVHIALKRTRLSDSDLRELLAIFFRYKLQMSVLARFETERNRHWFCDRQKYWHAKVFTDK